jgi:hypothetical protein
MDNEYRADILSAFNQVRVKFSRADWRALELLEDDLDPEETVLRLASGLLQGGTLQQNGLLVLTDRRLLFIRSGIIHSHQVSVPLDTVTAVSVSKGLLKSTLKTTGPQSNLVVNGVDKADAEAFASELRTILANRAHGMVLPPSSSVGHVADEIERLAALRDRGILTNAEFAAQKSKLLAGDTGT